MLPHFIRDQSCPHVREMLRLCFLKSQGLNNNHSGFCYTGSAGDSIVQTAYEACKRIEHFCPVYIDAAKTTAQDLTSNIAASLKSPATDIHSLLRHARTQSITLGVFIASAERFYYIDTWCQLHCIATSMDHCLFLTGSSILPHLVRMNASDGYLITSLGMKPLHSLNDSKVQLRYV